jgi:hypothetical protein
MSQVLDHVLVHGVELNCFGEVPHTRRPTRFVTLSDPVDVCCSTE